MTQTVILTQPVRVSGVVLDAGTTQVLARDIAADLVARGFATTVGTPVWQGLIGASQICIANSNVPLLIMPGDGGANGCTFTGTAGAFALSAAILATIGTALAECYAYFSANFGGSSRPAGWYFTKFSSDTAGIVYANSYASGKPTVPAVLTPFTENLTGRITASTSEIVALSGLMLPANALGKNGELSCFLRQAGSTTGNKTYRVRAEDASSSLLVTTGAAGSPVSDSLNYVSCADSHTRKHCGRSVASAIAGVGVQGTVYYAASTVDTCDTSINQRLAITMQGSSALSAPTLIAAKINATYGD